MVNPTLLTPQSEPNNGVYRVQGDSEVLNVTGEKVAISHVLHHEGKFYAFREKAEGRGELFCPNSHSAITQSVRLKLDSSTNVWKQHNSGLPAGSPTTISDQDRSKLEPIPNEHMTPRNEFEGNFTFKQAEAINSEELHQKLVEIIAISSSKNTRSLLLTGDNLIAKNDPELMEKHREVSNKIKLIVSPINQKTKAALVTDGLSQHDIDRLEKYLISNKLVLFIAENQSHGRYGYLIKNLAPNDDYRRIDVYTPKQPINEQDLAGWLYPKFKTSEHLLGEDLKAVLFKLAQHSKNEHCSSFVLSNNSSGITNPTTLISLTRNDLDLFISKDSTFLDITDLQHEDLAYSDTVKQPIAQRYLTLPVPDLSNSLKIKQGQPSGVISEDAKEELLQIGLSKQQVESIESHLQGQGITLELVTNRASDSRLRQFTFVEKTSIGFLFKGEGNKSLVLLVNSLNERGQVADETAGNSGDFLKGPADTRILIESLTQTAFDYKHDQSHDTLVLTNKAKMKKYSPEALLFHVEGHYGEDISHYDKAVYKSPNGIERQFHPPQDSLTKSANSAQGNDDYLEPFNNDYLQSWN